MLDVGCGWGSFAIHAATVPWRSGRRRDAVGLEDRIEIRVAGYREFADEPFDAVASIGMIEHGGARVLGIAPVG